MVTGDNDATAAVNEAKRPLEDRVSWVFTIAAGTFSVTTLFGLTLLPVNTQGQRALVLIACLALGVAAYSGVGAWRSFRRFTSMTLSASVALVCFAGLSITTDSAGRDRPSAGGTLTGLPTSEVPVAEGSRAGESPPSSPDAPTSFPPNEIPTESPSDPPAAGTWLTDERPIEENGELLRDGSSSYWQRGSRRLGATLYDHSLIAEMRTEWCGDDPEDWKVISFELGAGDRRLTATVGLLEHAPSYAVARFVVILDGFATKATI